GPNVFGLVEQRNGGAGRGKIGMDGENGTQFAAHALGEEGHGFGVERRDQVLAVDGFEIARGGHGDFNTVGGERVNAEGRVKNVVDAVDEGDARVFAAELFPVVFGNDELAVAVEMLIVGAGGDADS